jgi:TP901 family phage tail tape measure protein
MADILESIGTGATVAITIKAIDKFSSTFTKASTSMKALEVGLAAAATAAVAIGAALTKVATASVETAAEFNTFMQKAGANVRLTTEETEKYGDAVLGVANSLNVTGQEAAKTFQFLVGGSVSAKEGLDVLDETIKFAKANNIDYEKSAIITSQAMTLFGLTTEETAKTLDILTRSGQISYQKADQLANAFQEAAPMAAQLGVNIVDLTAILDAMGDTGTMGSEAGVALKRAMLELLKPSESAQEALQMLGLSAEQIQAQLSNPIEVLRMLENAMRDIEDPTQKAIILSEIFGKISGPAMAALLLKGVDSIDKLKTELENAGGTLDDVTNKVNAAENPFEVLRKKINNLGIDIGNELLPTMTDLMNVISEEVIPAIRPLIPLFGQALKQVIEAIIPIIRDNIDELQELARILFEELIPAALPLIPVVSQLISLFLQLAAMVGKFLAPVLNIINPLIVDLFNALKPILEPVTILIGAVFDLAEAILTSLAPVFKMIIPLAQALVVPLKWLIELISTIVEWLGKAYDAALEILGLEQKDKSKGKSKKRDIVRGRVVDGEVIYLNDFILTKSGKIIRPSPDDNIMGFKGKSPGNTIIFNIEKIQGVDPDDMMEAFQRELSRKISLS